MAELLGIKKTKKYTVAKMVCEGDYLTKKFRPVRQQEELTGATLLRLSRANGSSLC